MEHAFPLLFFAILRALCLHPLSSCFSLFSFSSSLALAPLVTPLACLPVAPASLPPFLLLLFLLSHMITPAVSLSLSLFSRRRQHWLHSNSRDFEEKLLLLSSDHLERVTPASRLLSSSFSRRLCRLAAAFALVLTRCSREEHRLFASFLQTRWEATARREAESITARVHSLSLFFKFFVKSIASRLLRPTLHDWTTTQAATRLPFPVAWGDSLSIISLFPRLSCK